MNTQILQLDTKVTEDFINGKASASGPTRSTGTLLLLSGRLIAYRAVRWASLCRAKRNECRSRGYTERYRFFKRVKTFFQIIIFSILGGFLSYCMVKGSLVGYLWLIDTELASDQRYWIHQQGDLVFFSRSSIKPSRLFSDKKLR